MQLYKKRYLYALAICLIAAGILLYLGEPDVTQQESHPLHSEAPWQKVVEYAQEHLPLYGELHVQPDGFGYLKVDDAYVHTLFPMLDLKKKGFREPPYFRFEDSPGAHISVFYVDEHVFPKEAGQIFPFTLKDIVIVHPTKTESYAILQVDAPALEKLREQYGLSKKLHGKEYHISLAKKHVRIRK